MPLISECEIWAISSFGRMKPEAKPEVCQIANCTRILTILDDLMEHQIQLLEVPSVCFTAVLVVSTECLRNGVVVLQTQQRSRSNRLNRA